MKIGSTNIANVKIGSTQIKEVRIGNVLVWQNFKGLLDLFPNAAAAYSLRKLRTAYAGSCIRVRRDSDNAESDIGFVANVLDTATLLTFCGAGNGFITTWYDQTTSANHLIQATAGKQPTIVSSGAMVTQNSKPSMFYDNVDDNMVTTNNINLTNTSYFAATQISDSTSSSDFNYLFSQDGIGTSVRQSFGKYALTGGHNNKRYIYDGATAHIDDVMSANMELLSLFFPTSVPYIKLWANGNSKALATLPAGQLSVNNKLVIGIIGGAFQPMNGNLSEFIVYTSNKETDRTAIETNINNHYAIF